MFERAIKLYEERVGIQHPRVSEILQNMAKLYLDAVNSNTFFAVFLRYGAVISKWKKFIFST